MSLNSPTRHKENETFKLEPVEGEDAWKGAHGAGGTKSLSHSVTHPDKNVAPTTPLCFIKYRSYR